MVHLHSKMIAMLSKAMPQLAYGYDCEKYETAMRVPEDWKFLHIDGSKFETTQYKALKRAFTHKVYDLLQPVIRAYSDHVSKQAARSSGEIFN